jgi:hypothetical protein
MKTLTKTLSWYNHTGGKETEANHLIHHSVTQGFPSPGLENQARRLLFNRAAEGGKLDSPRDTKHDRLQQRS